MTIVIEWMASNRRGIQEPVVRSRIRRGGELREGMEVPVTYRQCRHKAKIISIRNEQEKEESIADAQDQARQQRREKRALHPDNMRTVPVRASVPPVRTTPATGVPTQPSVADAQDQARQQRREKRALHPDNTRTVPVRAPAGTPDTVATPDATPAADEPTTDPLSASDIETDDEFQTYSVPSDFEDEESHPTPQLASQPVVNAQLPAQEPFVNAQWPAREPVVNAQLPAQEPVVNAQWPAREPVVNAQLPAQEPVVNAQWPAREPVVNAQLPAQEPVVNAQWPAREPVVNAQLPAQEPVVNAQWPTREPVVNARFPAQEPIVNAQWPAREPVVNAPHPRSYYPHHPPEATIHAPQPLPYYPHSQPEPTIHAPQPWSYQQAPQSHQTSTQQASPEMLEIMTKMFQQTQRMEVEIARLRQEVVHHNGIGFELSQPKFLAHNLTGGEVVIGTDGASVRIQESVFRRFYGLSKGPKDLVIKLMDKVIPPEELARSNFYGGEVFQGRLDTKESLCSKTAFRALVAQAEIQFPGATSNTQFQRDLRKAANNRCRRIAFKLNTGR